MWVDKTSGLSQNVYSVIEQWHEKPTFHCWSLIVNLCWYKLEAYEHFMLKMCPNYSHLLYSTLICPILCFEEMSRNNKIMFNIYRDKKQMDNFGRMKTNTYMHTYHERIMFYVYIFFYTHIVLSYVRVMRR